MAAAYDPPAEAAVEPASSLVLGIDPGLNMTGYAVLRFDDRSPQVVEAGVIRSQPRKPLEVRLQSIHEGLLEVIDAHSPGCVGLEELYSHYARPQTAIIMGHARGVICLAAGLRGVPIHSYAATQVKKLLTGNGRASKAQVQLAVTRLLNLDAVPEPPDVADAIAIGMCHFYLARQPG